MKKRVVCTIIVESNGADKMPINCEPYPAMEKSYIDQLVIARRDI